MKNNFLALSALLCIVAVGSCKKEEPAKFNKEEQAKLDRSAIELYLADNNLVTTEHPSGIFYVIETPGTGGHPPLSATVTVRYKGYYLDGTVFDQTPGTDTRAFPLRNLIEGWQIGIPLLQKGGKGLFFIPSALGYGNNPPPGVRSNAVLAFEIELVDF